MESTGLPALSIHILYCLLFRLWSFRRKKMFLLVAYACMWPNSCALHANKYYDQSYTLAQARAAKSVLLVSEQQLP